MPEHFGGSTERSWGQARAQSVRVRSLAGMQMNLHEQWFITATQASSGCGAAVGDAVGDGEGNMVGDGSAPGSGDVVGSGSGDAVGVGVGASVALGLGSTGRRSWRSRVHPASKSPASPSITIAARAVCAIFPHIMSDTLQFSNVTAVAGGVTHTLALREDGTVVGWGSNVAGQIGSAGGSTQPTPRPVPGAAAITKIAAGGNSSFALVELATP